MSRRLVWIDSVAMGIVLIVVGLSIFLVMTETRFPFYIGALLLGILFAAMGIVLVRQGLGRRPRSSAGTRESPETAYMDQCLTAR
jgi:uncharacterized membrane protein HdeD (DUF308 family)